MTTSFDDEKKSQEASERETIKNVEKTIELIEHLSMRQSEIGVREASRVLNVPKSTMQRMLNTLLLKNIVLFNEATENYRLGPGIIRLAMPYLNENYLNTISERFMEQLRDQIGETVGLHVHVNGKQLLIHQCDSREELKWSIPVGKPYPINVGASGKVLLAHLTPEETEAYEQTFEALTERTKLGAELRDDLLQVKNQGYSLSYGEFSIGEMGIAVPIFGQGRVLAALSIYGPADRLESKKIDYLIKRLQETSNIISEQIN